MRELLLRASLSLLLMPVLDAQAQCTATNVPTLPVTNQAVVCNSSNLITGSNVQGTCGSGSTSYLGGNEALITITPTVSGAHTITYSGQTWTSIWVYSGACPTQAGAVCVGSTSSSGSSQSITVTLTAGVQYWIIFDTFPSPVSPCPGTFSITAPLAPGAACGTTVHDPGGPSGNYANNTTFTQTYCPANPGDVVTLNFSAFGTEGCCDLLTIYNGNSTAAPVLGTYSGTNSPGVITSTAADGCITIRFTSDGSTVGLGWAAAVTCGPPPPPPNYCGTTEYDPGGAGGNYGNNVTFTRTYCPQNPGDVVTLDFTAFGTEGCCDFLTIYNGNSTAAPVIGTYSGTNNPGIITSTATNGCITIRFTSDGSTTGIGWAAVVSCTPPPLPGAACGTTVFDPGGASGNYANNTTFTRTYCPASPGDVVTLTFSAFGTEGCCDFLTIYNGSSTAAPVIGTYSGTNSPGVVSSTAADGCITIRFTSDGSTVGIGWAAAVSCGTPPPPPNYCGTTDTDPGGPTGNYPNSTTFTRTYCPQNPGDVVSLNFSGFSTEGCCDFLTIYNGSSTAAPVIGTYSGTNNPGLITSTAANGCITIRFTSDGSVNAAGWSVSVTCGTPPPPGSVCGTSVYDPGGPGSNYGNNVTFTQTYCPDTPGDAVSLSFSQFNTESGLDVLTVFNGNSTAAPVLGAYSGTGNPGTLTSTAANGCLTVRFVSDGSITYSGWTATVNCGPPPPPVNACNSFVYDPGGPGGNYGNSQNYTQTYCSPVPGEPVTLSFTQLGTEACCDFISVYNGNSTSAPLMGTFSGNTAPGSFTSTDPSGCITIRFSSDGSATGSGWAAVVTCGDPPPGSCSYVLTLNDSGNNGWGSSSVGVSINGGAFQPYTVASGSVNQVLIPANVGDVIIFNYNASGPNQAQNSYSLALSSGGAPLFASGSPPSAGIQVPYLVDCAPPPAPQEDCVGGITLCSNQAFNNNTNNTGSFADLTLSTAGCLLNTERQGTWYNFSPSTSGTLAFTINPANPADDYDFAIWGPYPPGSTTANACPPNSAPLRCSYAAPSGATGLNFSATDLSEDAFGDRWVRHMDVVEGQVYVMYISNWSQSGLAFNLTFNPASTASLDCTVLPLGLLDLSATPVGEAVELQWHSGTEAQASHFVVERSADGAAFEAVGTDHANPALAEQGHRLLDPAPLAGTIHYRVLEVAQDGSAKRSPTVVVHLGTARATVVPNPSGDRATLRSVDELPAGTILWLLDASGRRIRQLVTAATAQQVPLDLLGLEAGSYLILIQPPNGSAKAPVRFIKN